MTCYQPLIRMESLTSKTQAKDGHWYPTAHIIGHGHDMYSEKLMQIKLDKDLDNSYKNYKMQLIPCRKCIGCRLEYSKEWANRGYLESKKDKNTYFVTLTYNDENLPMMEGHTKDTSKGCLKPEHLKTFIHDLRQKMQRNQGITGIKYLMCGEYGSEEERPHYHAILYHCPLPLEGFYEPRLINHEFYYQHKLIEECWKHGFSNVSHATWNCIAYVARYITKKVYGPEAEEEYKQKGQIPEFLRMSKGIGLEYYNEHQAEIWKTDSITIKNKTGAVQQTPPGYYGRKLKELDEEKYKQIKDKREIKQKAKQEIKRQSHTYGFLEQLEIEERTHDQKSKMLRRAFEDQGARHK